METAVLESLVTANPTIESPFQGHYQEWRQRRFDFVAGYFGRDYFAGKTLLELGGGCGDLGHLFSTLGCRVTTAEARAEHVAAGSRLYPHLDFAVRDLERDFTDLGTFDIVLHVGLLYHLGDIDEHLRWVAAVTGRTLILETEVCDSDDPYLSLAVAEDAGNYDQSFTGRGRRPSPAYVQRVLQEVGFQPRLLLTPALNAEFHHYDWPVTNADTHAFGRWRHGLRRFWVCEKVQPASGDTP